VPDIQDSRKTEKAEKYQNSSAIQNDIFNRKALAFSYETSYCFSIQNYQHDCDNGENKNIISRHVMYQGAHPIAGMIMPRMCIYKHRAQKQRNSS
jgi:hypothetical protein